MDTTSDSSTMFWEDLLAENAALKSALNEMRAELESEREVLKRMSDTDTTLPISLYLSLLSVTRRKRAGGTALASAEQAQQDGQVRLDLLKARENLLMAAASASDGPTFFGHSRRWQSLKTERADAEEDARRLAQHVTTTSERLSKLHALEKQAWSTVVAHPPARPRSSRSNRPLSRQSDVTARPLRQPPSSFPSAIPILVSAPVITKKQETPSPPPTNTEDLPEIPDSPNNTPPKKPSEVNLRRHSSPPVTRIMPSIPHTSTPSPAPTPTPVKPSHSTSVPKLTRRVPPLLLPTKFHRNSIASSITSPRSRSSAADLSTGPPTPKSSRLEIPDPSIRDDSNSEADERARFRIPTLTISRDSLSTKPRHDRSVSASFDFKPFTIDPLIVAPPHRVVSAQGSSSLRSPPTRPPSSVSSPMDRGSSNEGALMKLGRGLFRSASRNGQRSPTPVVAAPPAPGHSDHGDVITIGKRSSQRLEPLVESWVMEQLDAPPPSPSAQEVAAYYSDGGKIPRPKSRRSFSGLLRLGGPR